MDARADLRRQGSWLALLALTVSACGAVAPTATPSSAPLDAPTSETPTPLLPVAATSTPECVPVRVAAEETVYPAVAIQAEVPVMFFLPACDAGPDGFPVVFLLHGKPMTEQQWLDLGVPDLLTDGWQSRRWPPMIVVAARQPEPVFSNTDGGPGSYEQEFFEGLVPFVESILPVGKTSLERAILGISRGGVWALELGMTHPADIGAVAALSPSLAVNYARPAYNPLSLAENVAEFPRIYLGAGDKDWARQHTERLSGLLESLEGEVRLEIVPGGHEDGTWAALLPSALDFIASEWKN